MGKKPSWKEKEKQGKRRRWWKNRHQCLLKKEDKSDL